MLSPKKQMTSLQEEFNNKSLLDNKRIYIIKEADKFNDSSANEKEKILYIFKNNIMTEHEKMFSEEGIKIKALIAKLV